MAIPNLTITNVAPDSRIFNDRPAGVVPSGILLHHTGGTNSLAYLSQYHANPVSIHKLVPKRMPDGKPGHYQIVPDSKRAWHAGKSREVNGHDWGDLSIGIEIENLGNGHDPYTAEQYETVAQIIAYNAARYHIPDSMVQEHKDVALPPGRKTDVDASFDRARLWRRVREIRADWPYDIPFWVCME